jgi:hypothetical protein
MNIRRFCISLISLLFFASGAAGAWEFSGTKMIYLHDKSGGKIEAGTVEFKPQGSEIAFDIQWNHAAMKDYFLSMREFKCFDGPSEVQCQVPYPYPNPKTISLNNFAWLENNLLFLYKAPKDFGANLWNGIYYELRLTPTGLVGDTNAIDLVAIGAPPDQPNVPPYPKSERSPMAEGSRWFNHLTIE